MRGGMNITQTVETLKQYKGAMPLSYSKMKILGVCPLQYKFRYIDKLKGTPPKSREAMIVGSFLHKVMEYCVTKGQSFGYRMECVDFSGTWEQVQQQLCLTDQEYAKAMAQREATKNVLQRVLHIIERHDMRTRPEMQICLGKNGKAATNLRWPQRLFFGYIDFFAITKNGLSGMFLDYKSHDKTEERDEEVRDQIAMYAYPLLRMHPGLEVLQGGCAYLPEENVDMHAPITRENTAELEERVDMFYARYLERLQAGVFDPVESKYCTWCYFHEQCPIQ